MFRWFFRRLRSTEPDRPDGGSPNPEKPSGQRPRQGSAPFLLPSLASATRQYALDVEEGTLSRVHPRDLARLSMAMGADLWAWQRARLLTGQPPWRASPGLADGDERIRAAEQMLDDIPTWERAMMELDADTRRAAIYGKPAPPPLAVPEQVMQRIEARRAAALEYATRNRRRQRSDQGDGSLQPQPEDAAQNPPAPPQPL